MNGIKHVLLRGCIQGHIGDTSAGVFRQYNKSGFLEQILVSLSDRSTNPVLCLNPGLSISEENSPHTASSAAFNSASWLLNSDITANQLGQLIVSKTTTDPRLKFQFGTNQQILVYCIVCIQTSHQTGV